MSGYSGTPLAKKLGIKPYADVAVINAPVPYRDLLGSVPDGVKIVSRITPSTTMVHASSKNRKELNELLSSFLEQLRPDGTIWISWPKKSSGMPSEVSEDTIRELAPPGLVDIKVCAVDDIWPGMKLVVRKENRTAS